MKLVDILLPPLCLSCKKEGSYICDDCKEDISTYNYFVCPMCKRRLLDGRLDKKCRKECGLTRYLGAPLPYSNEIVKKAIHFFKYKHAKEIGRPLSQILIEFLEKNKFREILSCCSLTTATYTRFVLIPIPLYNFKERERGFNQADEIAKYIGECYWMGVNNKVLRKHKNTPQQADIHDKEKRLANVSEAFSCLNPEGIGGKIGILVDDVYTTGATMRACALTLRSAGAREVWGMTVARG